MANTTLDYYNQNAAVFIEKTIAADVSERLLQFASRLPHGAHVLDVGCGSGRDTLSFLSRGFEVTAFDGSAEVAKQASLTINHPVQVVQMEDMAWADTFEGVWAMASLLHLTKAQLPSAIARCVRALKTAEAGWVFASFKQGDGACLDDMGRFFSYYQPDELNQLFEGTGFFESVTVEIDEDVLGRPGLQWISVLAQKKPGLVISV